MKKLFFAILLLASVAVIPLAFYYNNDGIVAIKNFLDIKPQQYYGATVDMSQILPSSKHYIVNSKCQDLVDIAASLGMNTLRITNIESSSDSLSSSYSHAQWEKVLGKMQSKGMFAIILIEANAQDTNFDRVNLNDYYLNF